MEALISAHNEPETAAAVVERLPEKAASRRRA